MVPAATVYPNLLDIGCFSHTLDHVGEKLSTPVLDEFSKAWINLFSQSPKSKLAWRTQTDLASPSYLIQDGGLSGKFSNKSTIALAMF